jgi:hypothetical protein
MQDRNNLLTMRQPDIAAKARRTTGRAKIPQGCGRLADRLNWA